MHPPLKSPLNMDMKQAHSFSLLILFSVSFISGGVDGLKLFVFGDSYVDTGNFKRNQGSWLPPYGSSFPGRPSGRFSDGRVLTDYIASFLGIKSPIPYKWRKYANKTQLKRGMNFAYGGSGVFDTWIRGVPNLNTQISHLELQLRHQIYTKQDLSNSVALVSTSGNDYAFYLQNNGSLQNMASLTRRIVKQLAKGAKHIHELGVGKVAVVGMGAVGCFPHDTIQSLYTSCNISFNLASKFHNRMLRRTLRKMNRERFKSVFVFLNLYSSSITAMNRALGNPLKPCCEGVTSENGCGERDKNGEKKYVLCKHPELSFFWDSVHPSQNGWHSIYLALQPSLNQLLLN